MYFFVYYNLTLFLFFFSVEVNYKIKYTIKPVFRFFGSPITITNFAENIYICVYGLVPFAFRIFAVWKIYGILQECQLHWCNFVLFISIFIRTNFKIFLQGKYKFEDWIVLKKYHIQIYLLILDLLLEVFCEISN